MLINQIRNTVNKYILINKHVILYEKQISVAIHKIALTNVLVLQLKIKRAPMTRWTRLESAIFPVSKTRSRRIDHIDVTCVTSHTFKKAT